MDKSGLLVVFDWDGVIFDTGLLKMVRAKALKKFGYDEGYINSTGHAVAETVAGYNLHSHAKELVRGSGHDARLVAKAIQDALERHPGDFVFADAKRTIAALKRRRLHFDILTAGHVEFQEYKILRSGLRPLFRDIHIVKSGPRVPGNKMRILKRISKERKFMFLDDRPDTIQAAASDRALRGKVVPVLVWRGKGKPPRAPYVLRKLTWKGLEEIAIHTGLHP